MGNYWLDKYLKMYTCEGVDYAIAFTLDDAKKIVQKQMGYTWDEVDEWDWMILDSDSHFAYEENGVRTFKTVQEWIDQFGEGYFATSEYA